MPESTLTLTYTNLLALVGEFMGVGRTPTGESLAKVNDAIDKGYRQFLNPIVPGQKKAHRWSFLTPVASITLAAGDYDYPLPDDFGGLMGTFTYPANTTSETIQVTGEGRIRELRAQNPWSGRPRLAALRPVAVTLSSSRFEVIFWPTPATVEAVTYRYSRLLNRLGVTNLYPVGGAQHSETILECCLAAAEQMWDDQQGLHKQASIERLAASILFDRSQGPDNLGYNADGSDLRAASDRLSEVLWDGQTMPF